ncbi:MAG TPA: pilus assembly protein PilP [Polyangiaceae bacterium]|nr:pilus assembly protein PilP [Polyangiaceae bacterium]
MMRVRLCLAGLTCAVLFACESEPPARAFNPAAQATTTLDRKAMASGASAPNASASAVPAKVDLQEFEFTESERSRDPFRSYEDSWAEETRTTTKSQRQVVLADRGIDELKLVGIVTGVPDAKAMLVDPAGKGHVVQRGQFIGRSELVHGEGQGGPTYEVNWRIDRIRDGDIVLVREDPKHPEVPSATRVIPLRTEPNAPIETLEAH